MFRAIVADQTTTMGHVKVADLKRLTAKIPPTDEQRRIAGVLGALDDKIEHNDKMADRAETLSDIHFRMAFLGDRRRRRPIGEIVGIAKASVAPSESPDEMFEHYSIPAFDNGRLPARELGSLMLSAKTELPDVDCILVSKLNPETRRIWWPRPRGRDRAVCSPEFIVLVPRSDVPASFVYASLRADQTLYSEILGHVTGTTGSRQRLRPSEMRECKVVAATSEELAEWDRSSRPLYELAGHLLWESAALGAIRDALLPKLVSGAIRVPASYDPDDALGTVAEAARLTG